MNVNIRQETPEDVAAIDATTVAAFLEAPHTDHTEQFIVKALRDAGMLSISLVAEIEGEVVGHVAVSPVSISGGINAWFGLGPISVSPEYQGRYIGSQLMRSALEELQKLGASGCVLLGDPAYYSRFGFKQEPGLVFQGVPPEYFQAVSFKGPLPKGTVSYHEAFCAKG